MGFGALRVINDDRVAAGRGFGTHPHRDMEIISYVVEGALEHKDSMGNGSLIQPGDVQRMTAGTGVSHSEFNPSPNSAVRFLQIWIIPEKRGLPPSYEQKFFGEERRNTLRLVASPEGRDGSVTVHQDVRLFASILEKDKEVHFPISKSRMVWIQVVSGQVSASSDLLSEGDALALSDEESVTIVAQEDANFLLFDLKDLSI
jgi:redox-sensitive bicupin YhaK (pirin superfamily)